MIQVWNAQRSGGVRSHNACCPHHVLSSDDEYSPLNVPVLCPHVDPLYALVENQIGELVDAPEDPDQRSSVPQQHHQALVKLLQQGGGAGKVRGGHGRRGELDQEMGSHTLRETASLGQSRQARLQTGRSVDQSGDEGILTAHSVTKVSS